MSLLAAHGSLLPLSASSNLAAIIAGLGPAQWFRLNDNAASSAVADSVSGGTAAVLYSAVTGSALSAKNTSLVSAAGLVAGDSDKCFNMGENSMIEAPYKALSNATGWTVFGLIKPNSAPALNVCGVFQLTANGGSAPELDVLHVSGTTFRFRVMLAGNSEVSMNATPTFTYGTLLAVALRKRAGGLVDIFCNGALIATSNSSPSFSYSNIANHYGSARFAGTSYYPLTGPIDECALWQSPLSDASCIALTTLP